jgi:hypothetical protein
MTFRSFTLFLFDLGQIECKCVSTYFFQIRGAVWHFPIIPCSRHRHICTVAVSHVVFDGPASHPVIGDPFLGRNLAAIRFSGKGLTAIPRKGLWLG